MFDDWAAVESNIRLNVLNGEFDSWRVALLSSKSGDLGRPVSMLSFALNQFFFGQDNTFALKAVNLVIHCLVAFLIAEFCKILFLYRFASRGSARVGSAAMIVALLWFLHPLHVSTVLYSVQRMAQLSTLFCMAGLLFYIHNRVQWAERGVNFPELFRVLLYLLLLTFLATLSKENGVLLPLLILVTEVCFFLGKFNGRTFKLLKYCTLAVFFVPVFLSVYWLFYTPDFISSGYLGRTFTLETRLLTQARLLWHYLGWIMYPNITLMGFHHDDVLLSSSLWAPITTAIAFVAWFTILALAFLVSSRFPFLLYALLFFLVGHSLESSFFALEMVFEHRNYLPSIGVAVALGATTLVPLEFGSNMRGRILVAVPICALAFLLMVRASNWSDGLTLSSTNVENNPNSTRANYWYGHWLLKSAENKIITGADPHGAELEINSARAHFMRMHQIDPSDLTALFMLHYVDQAYFPAAPEAATWLLTLAETARLKQLSGSDQNAIVAMAECFSAKRCSGDEALYLEVVEKAIIHYSKSASLLSAKFLILQNSGATIEELEALIDYGLNVNSGDLFFVRRKIERGYLAGNVTQMYDALLGAIFSDKPRRNLLILKSFIGPESDG